MDSTILQSAGKYPDNWRRIDFDHFTTLKRGKDLTREQFRDGTVPVAGSNGVIGYHDTANVAAPGVTVGRSGSVGRVTYYAQDFWAHNTALFVTDFHDNDPRFAAYFLDFLKLGRFSSGASVPTLDRNVFRMLPVVVPPLPEQQKITGVLGVVQRGIEQQERLLQLTAELKKTLLHQLFTHGVRGEPQKQTEIGHVPQSWKVDKIGEHCSSSAFGPRFSSDLYASDGNVVTLRTTDLDDDGNIDYREAPKARIDNGKFESHLLKIGDVVVSRSGTCGIAAVFEGLDMPVLPGAFLIRVRLTSGLRPQFLRYYINSPVGRPRIMNLAQGAIQKNISGAALKEFEVPVPSIEDQVDIEAHVEAIDRKLRLHSRKKQSLTVLFRTLLHQLMTAQIRVHDLPLPEDADDRHRG